MRSPHCGAFVRSVVLVAYRCLRRSFPINLLETKVAHA